MLIPSGGVKDLITVWRTALNRAVETRTLYIISKVRNRHLKEKPKIYALNPDQRYWG